MQVCQHAHGTSQVATRAPSRQLHVAKRSNPVKLTSSLLMLRESVSTLQSTNLGHSGGLFQTNRLRLAPRRDRAPSRSPERDVAQRPGATNLAPLRPRSPQPLSPRASSPRASPRASSPRALQCLGCRKVAKAPKAVRSPTLEGPFQTIQKGAQNRDTWGPPHKPPRPSTRFTSGLRWSPCLAEPNKLVTWRPPCGLCHLVQCTAENFQNLRCSSNSCLCLTKEGQLLGTTICSHAQSESTYNQSGFREGSNVERGSTGLEP